jgi:hypothetical protein
MLGRGGKGKQIRILLADAPHAFQQRQAVGGKAAVTRGCSALDDGCLPGAEPSPRAHVDEDGGSRGL